MVRLELLFLNRCLKSIILGRLNVARQDRDSLPIVASGFPGRADQGSN
jgi:hypothetical protein